MTGVTRPPGAASATQVNLPAGASKKVTLKLWEKDGERRSPAREPFDRAR